MRGVTFGPVIQVLECGDPTLDSLITSQEGPDLLHCPHSGHNTLLLSHPSPKSVSLWENQAWMSASEAKVSRIQRQPWAKCEPDQGSYVHLGSRGGFRGPSQWPGCASVG